MKCIEGAVNPYSIRYQSKERNDLLPPSYLKIKENGDKSSVPFEVVIDRDKLSKLLNIEGITGGASLQIYLAYRSPRIRHLIAGLKQLKDFTKNGFSTHEIKDTITKIGNAIFNYLKEGKEWVGGFNKQDHSCKIVLDLRAAYSVALVMSPSYEEVKKYLRR